MHLWEAEEELGGALRYAALAPRHEGYAAYLAWQIHRLHELGVAVELGVRADAKKVLTKGADVVAVATGAVPRTPDIPGVDLAHVVDARDVLAGRAEPGHRALVIAQDDHVAPLSVADFLGARGHEVTVVYATQVAAPLLGRYIIGGVLGRLSHEGVVLRFMEEVVRIAATSVDVRNVYSLRTSTIGEYDSVVLACGSVSDASLYAELKRQHPAVHVLGDAYAPRRLVFATRQAYALARDLALRA